MQDQKHWSDIAQQPCPGLGGDGHNLTPFKRVVFNVFVQRFLSRKAEHSISEGRAQKAERLWMGVGSLQLLPSSRSAAPPR